MARNVSLPNSGSGAAARARFEKFVQDRNALSPDDQPMVLSIIARNADAAAFEQLHAIAKSAKSETELRRDLLAMMDVADPQLAARAARIALSEPESGAVVADLQRQCRRAGAIVPTVRSDPARPVQPTGVLELTATQSARGVNQVAGVERHATGADARHGDRAFSARGEERVGTGCGSLSGSLM
jgi:hypothetical protein